MATPNLVKGQIALDPTNDLLYYVNESNVIVATSLSWVKNNSNISTAQNVVIDGDLTVSGSTVTVNAETLLIEDNIIVLNTGVTGTPTTNAGIEVERGTSTNVQIRWDESTDKWQYTNDGATFYNIIGEGTDLTGNLTGNVTGNLTGNVTGNLTGNVTGNVSGNVTGNTTGNVTGNLTGNVTGNVSGDVTGNVTGNLAGNVTGSVTGNVSGNVTGNLSGNVTGNLSGNVTGNLSGNVTGNVSGNVTGDVTGNLSGNVTGDVTGNVSGNAGTATKLTTARTIELTGPVTGSASFDGSSNVSITTSLTSESTTIGNLSDVTIASAANGDFLRYNGSVWINDAVNLSTDTIGEYVAFLNAGSGVFISNNEGEGATPTISIGQSIGTGDSPTFAGLTVGNISNAEIGYLDGVTSAIQTQLNNKSESSHVHVQYAPLATPNFTGPVSVPKLFVNDIEIDTAGASNTQVLKYNSSTNKFVPGVASTVASLDDLTDVVIDVGVTNGEVLTWDATSSKWINAAATGSSGGLSYFETIGNGIDKVLSVNHALGTRDVSVTVRNAISPYDVINVNWEATDANTVTFAFATTPGDQSVRAAVFAAVAGSTFTPTAFRSLTDVSVASRANNDILIYDSSAAKWINNGSLLPAKAPLSSPTFTGTPRAETASEGTNNTQIATTAFVASSSILKTIVTAKGDLVTATANNAPTVLNVGTNGYFLKANSSANAGIEWTAIPTINNLDDIGNVSAATPNTNEVLQWNGTTWVSDIVALGTDTSGDYVSSLVAGTGITLANNSGEGSTPTISVDTSTIATKTYVDNTAAGIVAKPSVLGATVSNVTGTYYNGPNDDGVGATLTHDSNGAFPSTAGGATGWAVGKGILLKNQTDKKQNGRYFVSNMGSVSTPYVLTRCGYCDEADEIPGAYIFVQNGTLAGTGWIQVVADPATFVVGTDNIDVFQFSGAGTYLGGDGLVLTDNTFNVGTASNARIVVNAENIDLATVSVSSSSIDDNSASSAVTSVTVDSYGRVTGTTTRSYQFASASVAGVVRVDPNTLYMDAGALGIKSLSITDGYISNSAAISYSKLSLSNSISTTDLQVGAARGGFNSTLNEQSTGYTLQSTDLAKLVTIDSASNVSVTVPNILSNGDRIDILRKNATGEVTIVGGSGVTVNGTPGLKLRAQWSGATLVKLAANTWVVMGDLKA